MGRTYAFVDVETTGLHSADRIVSLGLAVATESALDRGQIDGEMLHLLFDPGRKSHPRAEEVHGWDDWTLRHQAPFAEHASAIAAVLARADTLVAHNAEFDTAFLTREFERSGQASPPMAVECTMLDWRAANPGARASLSAVIGSLGLKRSAERHGAMEDAWLAMAVHAHLRARPRPDALPAHLVRPTNIVAAPPRPEGPLPRRNARRAAAARASATPEIPVTPATPEPPVIVATDLRVTALLAEAVPLATVMMEVAAADHVVTLDELDAFMLLLRDVGERLAITDVLPHLDALDALFELADSPRDINGAVSRILASDWQRDSIARWIREITYADGGGSVPEQQAIARILDAVRSARR